MSSGRDKREDQDGVGPRPLEDRLDEVDQAGVGPLQVLEDHDGRAMVGDAFEKGPPRRVQLLTLSRRGVGEAEQVGEAGLDPAALLGVGHELGK